MKISKTFFLIITCLISLGSSYSTSIFYCGFGGDYCGQSNTDDVNPSTDFIILAFANTKTDGSIIVDSNTFPTALVTAWKAKGKKIILSVGGQNGNWAYVFATQTSINLFINSLVGYVHKYTLDGVDLDI